MANLRELWMNLRAADPADAEGDVRMRLVSSGCGVRLFAAITTDRRDAALVIECARDLLPQNLSRADGQRMTIVVDSLPGVPTGRVAAVVRLLDDQYEDLFAHFGNCLAEGIQTATTAAAAVGEVVRQIERWRRFVEKRRGLLSNTEARGLIGELAVLERLIVRCGPSKALDAWKAPYGSLRDFECDDVTIEVKSFSAATGATIHINDLMQLEPADQRPLILACQELAQTTQVSCSLPGHVARLTRFLRHDKALAEDFEEALAQCGYLLSHAPLYTDLLALGSLHAFMVTSTFPRIAARTVPPEVTAVHYSIRVATLASFAVAVEDFVGCRHSEVLGSS